MTFMYAMLSHKEIFFQTCVAMGRTLLAAVDKLACVNTLGSNKGLFLQAVAIRIAEDHSG